MRVDEQNHTKWGYTTNQKPARIRNSNQKLVASGTAHKPERSRGGGGGRGRRTCSRFTVSESTASWFATFGFRSVEPNCKPQDEKLQPAQHSALEPQSLCVLLSLSLSLFSLSFSLSLSLSFSFSFSCSFSFSFSFSFSSLSLSLSPFCASFCVALHVVRRHEASSEDRPGAGEGAAWENGVS